MMFIYKVPLTWHILEALPLFILLFLLSFGGASIMLHFGVFIKDLANIVTVILRLFFYLSGIFYDIGANKTIANNALYSTILLRVNPIAMIMDGLRNCLLYGQSPDWLAVGIWTVLGVLLCAFGVHLIHKYESAYYNFVRWSMKMQLLLKTSYKLPHGSGNLYFKALFKKEKKSKIRCDKGIR